MSEGIAVVYKALAAAQAKFQSIDPDAVGKVAGKEGRPGYQYEYATLAKIISQVRPALNEHGFFLSQPMWTAEDGSPCVRTVLHHESGHSIESGVATARPLQGGMQAMGGVVSYLKRYQLTAFLGLSVGELEDDDGAREEDVKEKSDARRNGIEMPRAKAPSETPSTPTQSAAPGLSDGAKKALRAAMIRAGVDDPMLREMVGHGLEDMPLSAFNAAMKSLVAEAQKSAQS